MTTKHTPGPWPYECTGDGKRITIGKGLVEGPNGYEVAEVYSDDCDSEEVEANARLIASAPSLLERLEKSHTLLVALYVSEPDKSRREIIADHLDANSKIIAKAKGE